MSLNSAQARSVMATFTHVSELLDDVLKLAREDLSPFDRRRADLSPAEVRRLMTFVSSIRSRMLEALETLGIEPPKADTSARWSVGTSLLFSRIALSDVSAAGLRGYGAVSLEDGDLVASLSADLSRLVERAQDMLQGVDPGSVEEIIERVRGPEGDALRVIWHFARRYELIDTYADIAAVGERASAPAVDVGIFGRTNAGKSSLINALVGQDVLPVGPAPTTAIPLRLALGPAGLRVHRDGEPDEELPLNDLRSFGLASIRNGNRRHGHAEIVALDAFVPTAPPGLRLIDTPGVGSHSASGGAQAFEWIPRCDLGLLLVSAGSALEMEDVAIARGLLGAGVDLTVILSKADLLTADEVEASRSNLRDELSRHLGESTGAILPVSVVGDGATAPLERLRNEILSPLADEQGQPLAARLRRRLQHLLREVEVAFEAHASETGGTVIEGVEALRAAVGEASASF